MAETIIITGSSVERPSHDSPLTIAEMSEIQLQQAQFNSQADILRHLPGVKAEGGGGELASNIAIVGMPFAGQYEFTPLLYDGLPAFSTFGLNSSAFDVYIRNDLSLERLEFVRGGITNLFGPASTVGLFNYVSKSPLDYDETILKLAVSSEQGQRFDFYHGQLIDLDSAWSISGFTRNDSGPIDTGLESTGWQLKGRFETSYNDEATLAVFGQVIDDRVQFYLPLPLDGHSLDYATGNNGQAVKTLQTSAVTSLQYILPNNHVYRVDIEDGVYTRGGMIGADWQQPLGDWLLGIKGKYADYQHEFNLFLDGDGLTGNVPLSQTDYLAARGVSVDEQTLWQFTTPSGPLAPDDRVFGNRILDRNRPARDAVIEANLTRHFDWLGSQHTFTAGIFYADAAASDINVITGFLTTFNNRPELVHAEAIVQGSQQILATQGLVQPSGFTKHERNFATREALYLVDQIALGELTLDLGARFEHIAAKTRRQQIKTAPTSSNEHLHPLLTHTGTVEENAALQASVSDEALALALGALYPITDRINLYANISDSFYFPQIRTIQLDAKGQPNSFDEERLKQAELGVKYQSAMLNASLAFLQSTLKDRRLYTFVNDAHGGITEQIDAVATDANGTQLTLNWQASPSVSLGGNLTWQDLAFTKFDRAPEFIGNRPVRTAKLTWDAHLSFTQDPWHANLSNTYVSDTYANNANTIKLKAYHLTNATLEYRVRSIEELTLSLSIFNLFDNRGITEGSPRQGDNQAIGEYFVGRPVLPMRTTLSFSYRF